jgi:hypothetical protein
MSPTHSVRRSIALAALAVAGLALGPVVASGQGGSSTKPLFATLTGKNEIGQNGSKGRRRQQRFRGVHGDPCRQSRLLGLRGSQHRQARVRRHLPREFERQRTTEHQPTGSDERRSGCEGLLQHAACVLTAESDVLGPVGLLRRRGRAAVPV